MITPDPDKPMKQAPAHIRAYLREAIKMIDEAFGEGYSKEHPELVARFIQAASMDSAAAVLARGLKGIAEAIVDA